MHPRGRAEPWRRKSCGKAAFELSCGVQGAMPPVWSAPKQLPRSLWIGYHPKETMRRPEGLLGGLVGVCVLVEDFEWVDATRLDAHVAT